MKPSLKKPGDFTVAEGHGHPLVSLMCSLPLEHMERFFVVLMELLYWGEDYHFFGTMVIWAWTQEKDNN
jgi:hypothetical protein